MQITLAYKGKPVVRYGLHQSHYELKALLHFVLARYNTATAIGDERRSTFWFNMADRICRLQRIVGEV